MGGTHCWWCVHPFQGQILHMPIKYDDKLKKYTTMGEFCNWSCMKAYAHDINTPKSYEYQAFISMMCMQTHGKYQSIRKAPKRQALKMFGGSLTIEEFRSTCNTDHPVRLPNETFMQITERTTKETAAAPAAVESLKLKRDKPLQRAASKLEQALGIKAK